MKPRTVTLLVVLAVVIMAAIAEYTAGGGWRQVVNEVDREARMKALEPRPHDFLKLPEPMGRKDAPAQFEFFVENSCTCLQGNVAQIVTAFWSMQERAHVVFKPIPPEMKPKPGPGKIEMCETLTRINGLETLRAPWQEKPIISGGKGAAAITDRGYKRLVDWLATAEGQASVKRQLEAEKKAKAKRGGA
jgi:hypothetical protein